MGYDISYHAIGKDEISQWYFKPLKLAQRGDFESIAKIAREAGVDEFYVEKYADGFRSALQYGTQGILIKRTDFTLPWRRAILESIFTRAARRLAFWRSKTLNLNPT
ncbi:hypothetical protein [uncultured Campylobacter sp.]|uniref:hypothetical protein n=1 Tax=uncultured Campylobacter sp. TaxID=218934 RepID=UPI0026164EA7|nr:hypothetical protein [uncultured Campylobacter sp.]